MTTILLLGLGFILLLGGACLLAAIRSAPLGTQYPDRGFVAGPNEEESETAPGKRVA